MEPGKNSPLLTIVPDGWDFFRGILEELVVKAREPRKMLNSANTFWGPSISLWPLNLSWSHQVILKRWCNPDILWRDQRPFEAVLFKTAYICWWQRSTSGTSVCLCCKYVTKKTPQNSSLVVIQKILKLNRAMHISEAINEYSEVLYVAYRTIYCYFELL